MVVNQDQNKGRAPQLTSSRLIVFTCLYFEIILNLSLWRFVIANLEVNSVTTLIFGASLPVFLFIGLYFILNVLLWPYIYKPVLVTLVILSSIANYVMYQYGIFIDSDMMRNVFETNQREAFDYVNPSGFLWLLFSGLIPSVLVLKSKVVFPPILKEIRNRSLALLVCLLLLGLMAVTLYKEYVIFGRKNRQITRLINPVNYIYGTWRYFQRQALAKREFVRIDEDVRHASFEDEYITVFVVVVGETARAMNFSLNGYERNTNPLMSGLDVISYKDVTASGTATAISLPAMFSQLPRSKFKLNDAVYSENIIDLLANSGYEVVWLENDNGCKKVCDRVFTRDMVAENNPKYCDGTYCFDEVMIEPLEKILGEVEKDTVIVLHAIGSHGPSYYKRYPDGFKAFQPTCDTSEVQNCPSETIVNTYDNTIVYTDYFLNQVINALQKHPQLEAGMLYVSDHGESLGENGIYLHGLPFSIAPDEQIKVPMILWMSETMKTEDHIDYECLRQRAAEPYSHDNLFHSLAGLMEIDTQTYEADLDLFTPCRLKPLPGLADNLE